MTHDVYVTVSSTVGKGKSTVAAIVAKALHEAGITVSLLDDDCIPALAEKATNGATWLVKKGTTVQVQTVQLFRSGKPDLMSVGIPLE